jgi:hypothetical protein
MRELVLALAVTFFPCTALGDTPCGGQIVHPPDFRDDPLAQRACCLGERDYTCEPGLTDGKSPAIDARGTVCDPSQADQWKKAGTYEECRCGKGSLEHASTSCIRKTMYETSSCALVAATASGPAVMSLFVAGFNHGRLSADAYVDDKGVSELVAAIEQSRVDPRQVVVAFSASMEASCTADSFAGDDGIQNGECVANGLKKVLRRNFTYTAWHLNRDLGKRGGFAVITGERWVVDATENWPAPNGYKSLIVYLRDTKDGTGRTRQPLYVVHMGGPLQEKLRPFVEHARSIQRHDDLAPLFVGDMNIRSGDSAEQTSWCDTQLLWRNKGLSCSGDRRFSLEDQLMHVFSGRSDAKDPTLAFPQNIRSLQPTAIVYSSESPGVRPVASASGIWLPNVGHNVIGLNLALANPPGKTCAELGGQKRDGVCLSDEYVKGIASDAPVCCAPICDPTTQPRPDWGPKGGACITSCTKLGGKHCASPGGSCGSDATDLGESWDCDRCCKPKPIPPPPTCPQQCEKGRTQCITSGGKSCGNVYKQCLKNCSDSL